MTLGELIGPEAKLLRALARVPIAGLAADSRAVKPGFLFAALAGREDRRRALHRRRLAAGRRGDPRAGRRARRDLHAAVVEDSDPRRRLALIASRFFGLQPKTAVAVTGTNGKTSVASFVRQLWAGQGFKAASLGTVGVVSPRGTEMLKHTTPDPIELHAILAGLAKDGVTHLALEASSHGLQQRRVDGVTLAAGAFTNITRDHLDYHASFEDYFAQKLRLFRELLPRGAGAVVDVDSEAGEQRGRRSQSARARAHHGRARGQDLAARLRRGAMASLRTSSSSMTASGTRCACRWSAPSRPLTRWSLQALAWRPARSPATVLPMLETLQGARGRLDLAGIGTWRRADLHRLRPHARCACQGARCACGLMSQNRLVVVFGCGGDRDKGKRPEMGRVAVEKADLAIVTDDNPRSEDPAAIRRQILAAAPGAIEIGDRAAAIAEAIAELERGDVLLVAGKGHETGQTVGDDRHSLFRPRRGGCRAEARGALWLSRSGPSARS